MFWGAVPEVWFKLFGYQHILVILIIVCIIILINHNKKRLIDSRYEKYFRYAIAALLIIQTLVYQAWLISNSTWSIKTSLPFSICECAAFLCIYMLVKNSKRAFEVAYFAGVVISTMAVLTPALDFSFPHVRFIEYFMEHGLIVIAPVYMLLVHGYRPTKKALWKTVVAMNCCFPFITVLNYITGGNYWFVANKPRQDTLLDIMGPYPWYIIIAEMLGIVLFCIFLLPFELFKRKKSGRSSDCI